MEDKNCELLFEYLRSILYDTPVKSLDINELDEPFQKLGMGLQYLEKAVTEMKQYSEALSIGNLSVTPPSRDNFLCENLKNIHANLNHLTWQAKQVAKGDYSQTVSYLGEFSEAFNIMTAQLREREALLKNEAEKEKKRVQTMTQYTDFLVELTRKRNELILVVDTERKVILYSNQGEAQTFQTDAYGTLPKLVTEGLLSADVFSHIRDWDGDTDDKITEITDAEGCIFEVNSTLIEWQGIPASAHIITDLTSQKRETRKLTSMAYHDTLTGIKNRVFFDQEIRNLLQEKTPLSFCYMDLDHLKFVNDRYGHLEGDTYIRNFTHIVNENIREEDTFIRIGGDEFCLIIPGCEKAYALPRMEEILEYFRHYGNKPYPMGFSYGVVELKEKTDPEEKELEIEEILRQSDALMYQHKRKHKKYL